MAAFVPPDRSSVLGAGHVTLIAAALPDPPALASLPTERGEANVVLLSALNTISNCVTSPRVDDRTRECVMVAVIERQLNCALWSNLAVRVTDGKVPTAICVASYLRVRLGCRCRMIRVLYADQAGTLIPT